MQPRPNFVADHNKFLNLYVLKMSSLILIVRHITNHKHLKQQHCSVTLTHPRKKINLSK